MDNGYKSVRIKPIVDCYDIEWAKGTIPTPYGLISVSWEKKDGALILDVSIPQNCEMNCEVILPDGQTFCMDDNYKKFTCKL